LIQFGMRLWQSRNVLLHFLFSGILTSFSICGVLHVIKADENLRDSQRNKVQNAPQDSRLIARLLISCKLRSSSYKRFVHLSKIALALLSSSESDADVIAADENSALLRK